MKNKNHMQSKGIVQQNTLEGLLVPNTQLNSKLIEVSTHALNFSLMSITPETNSNVTCFSCLENEAGLGLIIAIAHSPLDAMTKTLSGSTLPIF